MPLTNILDHLEMGQTTQGWKQSLQADRRKQINGPKERSSNYLGRRDRRKSFDIWPGYWEICVDRGKALRSAYYKGCHTSAC